MRCIKANRPCSGYEHGAAFPFRHHAVPGPHRPVCFPTTARKCGIPKRVPIPGTNTLPEDDIPTEVSQAESNGLALRAFFYDYCVVSMNQSLSRGYFSSMEMLAYHLGPTSDLVKACQAVAFGTHGKPLNRPRLVQKSQKFYQDLLGSFARSIDSHALTDTSSAIHTSTLLGLYQVTVPLIVLPTERR